MKREEFWLARRKDDIYAYESAKLLIEPFKSVCKERNLINIFGLILEYNEKDATVSVVDLKHALYLYSKLVNCDFAIDEFRKSRRLKLPFLKDLEKKMTAVVKPDNKNNHCKRVYKKLRMGFKKSKNLSRFWEKSWGKVIGVVDYVDPIKSAIRTWDLKFAVMPCELKWSNNLMMVLPKNVKDLGKCLKFTAATQGEIFVVIASTPSDQKTWYIFQITKKGVIFYRVSQNLFYEKLIQFY